MKNNIYKEAVATPRGSSLSSESAEKKCQPATNAASESKGLSEKVSTPTWRTELAALKAEFAGRVHKSFSRQEARSLLRHAAKLQASENKSRKRAAAHLEGHYTAHT